MVYKLFDQGSFQLLNGRDPSLKPLQIFVAPTLLELQHVTGVPLVPNPASLTDGAAHEDEAPTTPMNLFLAGRADLPPVLVPVSALALRKAIAVEAAARALALSRRLALAAASLSQRLAFAADHTIYGSALDPSMPQIELGLHYTARCDDRPAYKFEGTPDCQWWDASRGLDHLLTWGYGFTRGRRRF